MSAAILVEMTPETLYALVGDLHLAYQTVGEGAIDLVLADQPSGGPMGASSRRGESGHNKRASSVNGDDPLRGPRPGPARGIRPRILGTALGRTFRARPARQGPAAWLPGRQHGRHTRR